MQRKWNMFVVLTLLIGLGGVGVAVWVTNQPGIISNAVLKFIPIVILLVACTAIYMVARRIFRR